MIYGIGAFMWTVVVIDVNRFVLARAKHIIEREKEAAEIQYRSYLDDLNAIAAELRQHGITLKTVPIDPAETLRGRQDRESNA